MKKKTGNKPVKKADTLNESRKKDKKTIIVLVIAALIFFGAFFSLHSEDILKDTNDIFWPYGDEIVEFEKAKVMEIVSEEIEYDELIENAAVGKQELSVIVKSGRYKGENMIVQNYFGAYYGVPVEVGDGVTLTIKTHSDGAYTGTVYEFNRIPILAAVIGLFFVVVVIIGGRTGLKSLIGLVFTLICLFSILIPLIIKGVQPIPVTFIMCAYIALVCFTILGGVHRKTISAFLGTVSGALFAMIFGLAVQYIAKIDGLRLEDAEPLIQLKYNGGSVYIRGLLVASIIICALGAVMDVAMSISSALEEVHAANPSFGRNELFRSGMNIGRDMVGTMTNTLILAFLGGEFTLMIFLYARDLTFYHMFSTAFIAIETISGISSSIGMVLAIPLTAFISSSLISKGKK
ncbi:MAG: YibE/F family protein [Clostridiales bacterium]|nr:YibE/F family protein [Clostridiales bacterium]